METKGTINKNNAHFNSKAVYDSVQSRLKYRDHDKIEGFWGSLAYTNLKCITTKVQWDQTAIHLTNGLIRNLQALLDLRGYEVPDLTWDSFATPKPSVQRLYHTLLRFTSVLLTVHNELIDGDHIPSICNSLSNESVNMIDLGIGFLTDLGHESIQLGHKTYGRKILDISDYLLSLRNIYVCKDNSIGNSVGQILPYQLLTVMNDIFLDSWWKGGRAMWSCLASGLPSGFPLEYFDSLNDMLLGGIEL